MHILHQYLNNEHSEISMMAEDVVFTIMATGQEHHRPEGISRMLQYFYHLALEINAEAKNTFFADGKVLWEGYFVGKHIGEFAGVSATGKEVRIPLGVVYDLENNRIMHGCVYLEVPVLMAQLGVSNG